MAVKIHWIDNAWQLQSAVPGFAGFRTSHTDEAASDLPYSIICSWGLENKVLSTTTENVADIVKGVELLRKNFVRFDIDEKAKAERELPRALCRACVELSS